MIRVCSAAAHTSRFGKILSNADVVFILSPTSCQGHILGHLEGIIGFIGYEIVARIPSNKCISFLGCCLYCNSFSVVVNSSSSNFSRIRIVTIQNDRKLFQFPFGIKPLRFACVVGRVDGVPRKGAVIVPCEEGIVLVLHRHGQSGAFFQHTGRNGLHAVRNRNLFQIGKIAVYRKILYLLGSVLKHNLRNFRSVRLLERFKQSLRHNCARRNRQPDSRSAESRTAEGIVRFSQISADFGSIENLVQLFTVIESRISDVRQISENLQLLQPIAETERRVPDLRNSAVKRNRLQRFAILEGNIVDCGHIFRQLHRFKRLRMAECAVSDQRHTVRQFNRNKPGASVKGKRANLGYPVFNCQIGKRNASCKRITPNGFDLSVNPDFFQ